jgi:hypothetical protein
VTLLVELDAFYLDHRRCGELEAGVDRPTVWMDCECGATVVWRVDDEEREPAQASLLLDPRHQDVRHRPVLAVGLRADRAEAHHSPVIDSG